MGDPLQGKLVIGIASSALFDLTDSDAVFREDGTERYRAHQRAHEDDPLKAGPAYCWRPARLGGERNAATDQRTAEAGMVRPEEFGRETQRGASGRAPRQG